MNIGNPEGNEIDTDDKYDLSKNEKSLLRGGERADEGTKYFLENPSSINPRNKLQVAMIKFIQNKEQSVSDKFSQN